MVNNNKYTSYDNLKLYDENIKGVIDAKNTETLESAKQFTIDKVKEVAGFDPSDLYTKIEVDTALEGKSDVDHNHDEKYDAFGSAQEVLDSTTESINTIASTKANLEHNHTIEEINDLQSVLDNKSQIQFVIWEDGD